MNFQDFQELMDFSQYLAAQQLINYALCQYIEYKERKQVMLQEK